jgi:hypothetical protein
MGVAMAWGLDDILKLLDRWGEWKNMRAAPARLDELLARVAELEQKLIGPWPPDVCRFCGERAARLDFTGIEKGIGDCKACKKSDWRYSKAA